MEPRASSASSSTARRSARCRAPGSRASLRDTIIDLNARHLSKDAETIYEALEDDGLTTAAINITCYRGRTRHLPTIPGVPAVYGPKRFFFYSLYESDRTGAPIAVRNRALGSIDAYAASVGRWLVTRDGFDLLVYYLPDYDYASHAAGPDTRARGARSQRRRSRRADGRCRRPRGSSSSATPSSSAPTTASRRSSGRRRASTWAATS